MTKKLPKQIESKLTKLSELLDKIDEARVIDSVDPETWDSDTLANLTETLKETLTLLEDKKSKRLDDWGQPIILEEGLCSLVDEYHSEEEEQDEDF